MIKPFDKRSHKFVALKEDFGFLIIFEYLDIRATFGVRGPARSERVSISSLENYQGDKKHEESVES